STYTGRSYRERGAGGGTDRRGRARREDERGAGRRKVDCRTKLPVTDRHVAGTERRRIANRQRTGIDRRAAGVGVGLRQRQPCRAALGNGTVARNDVGDRGVDAALVEGERGGGAID